MKRESLVLVLFVTILGICTLITVSNLKAQTWTTYTDASYISGIVIDGTDLWAGADGGLVMWDIPSTTYIKYTVSEGLADQNIKEVFIDAGGDIWIGTTEGVQRFNGSLWTTYNTSNSLLPNNTVYSITQDLSGTMWFGTGSGCAAFDGVTWTAYTNLGGATDVAVRGIGVDSLNQIWTANNPNSYGDPGGVSRFDGSVWTLFDPDPTTIGQYFLSLAVDNSDNVWAGSWTNWVFMYNGSSWTHYDSGNSGLVGTNIEAISVESDNTVWIGNHASSYNAATNGLTKYNGSTWTTYTTASSGLPASYVYAIDAQAGTVYVGTSRHGSAAYNGAAWSYYVTTNEPHTNWITRIDKGVVGLNDDGIYFGTDYYGIAKIINGIWSSYTTANSGLGDNYINDIHIENGTLWVASQFTGLWEFDGTSWSNFNTGNSGLLGDVILSIDLDSAGTVWLGTSGWSGPMGQDGALTRYDGSTWTSYYLENSGLVDDDGLYVKVDSSDIIWIGTEEGVSKFDGGSTWVNYTSSNSNLIENHVQAITFDGAGGTWFGTRGGISHMDSGEVWTNYTTADGLPSNVIRELITASSGDIWAASAGGIAVYQQAIGWTAYTQSDGLADNDVTTIAEGDGGIFWIGTTRSGISAFDPSPIATPTVTPEPTSTPGTPDIPSTSPLGILLILLIMGISVTSIRKR
ncbi:hypothetical protein JW979_14820 [bacterium]|nr:hypothetical protein [candidate division CSSED10-310 bacterium]